MNQSGAKRVTCPSCRLQFEPSGRNARCPVCGVRVSSPGDDYQPLPLLPEGLRARAAGAEAMSYGRETRWGLAAAAALFLMTGAVALVHRMTDSSPASLAGGVTLIVLALASLVASKGFQVTGEEGVARHLADAPIYLLGLSGFVLSLGSLSLIIYAAFLIHIALGALLLVIFVSVGVLALMHFGEDMAPWQFAYVSFLRSHSFGMKDPGGHMRISDDK